MNGGLKGVEILYEPPTYSGGDFLPPLDDTYDLGSAAQAWQDGYFDGIVYTDVIAEHGSGVGVTIDGMLIKDSIPYCDIIAEATAGTGVTIDGVKLKDSQPYCDVINEKTTATGVTVDGVLLKDSYISLAEATLPAATVVYVGRDNSGDVTVNVLTGKKFHVAVAGVDALDVALGTITIAQSLIDHNPAALSGTPGTTGAWFDQAAQTFTDNVTAAAGTVAIIVYNAFGIPVFDALNGAAGANRVTATKAATVYIAGAPIPVTDKTLITDSYGLDVEARTLIAANSANPALTVKQDGGGAVMRLDIPVAQRRFFDLYCGGANHSYLENAGGDFRFYSVAGHLKFISASNTDVSFTPQGTGRMVLVGGMAFKSADATEIGLQVSNGALTVGSEGSIEIPYLSQTGALFTDAIGGNLDGCIGINFDSDTGSTATLEARVEGAWLSVALAGVGIQSKVPYHPNAAWVHPNQIYQTEGRQWMNETRCVVCGEPLRRGEPALPWVNIADNGAGDMHAIYGHMHLENDAVIQEIKARIAALEGGR